MTGDGKSSGTVGHWVSGTVGQWDSQDSASLFTVLLFTVPTIYCPLFYYSYYSIHYPTVYFACRLQMLEGSPKGVLPPCRRVDIIIIRRRPTLPVFGVERDDLLACVMIGITGGSFTKSSAWLNRS